jgi:hypothetical protein
MQMFQVPGQGHVAYRGQFPSFPGAPPRNAYNPGMPPTFVPKPGQMRQGPINFISVNNNFTNNQTFNLSQQNKNAGGRFNARNKNNYIMKFNSKNDNQFYISANLSKRKKKIMEDKRNQKSKEVNNRPNQELINTILGKKGSYSSSQSKRKPNQRGQKKNKFKKGGFAKFLIFSQTTELGQIQNGFRQNRRDQKPSHQKE